MKTINFEVDSLFITNGMMQDLAILQDQLIDDQVIEPDVWNEAWYIKEHLEELRSKLCYNHMESLEEEDITWQGCV